MEEGPGSGQTQRPRWKDTDVWAPAGGGGNIRAAPQGLGSGLCEPREWAGPHLGLLEVGWAAKASEKGEVGAKGDLGSSTIKGGP